MNQTLVKKVHRRPQLICKEYKSITKAYKNIFQLYRDRISLIQCCIIMKNCTNIHKPFRNPIPMMTLFIAKNRIKAMHYFVTQLHAGPSKVYQTIHFLKAYDSNNNNKVSRSSLQRFCKNTFQSLCSYVANCWSCLHIIFPPDSSPFLLKL